MSFTSPGFFNDERCEMLGKIIRFDEIESYYDYGICHYKLMKGEIGFKKAVANLRKSAALGYKEASLRLGLVQSFSPNNFDRLEGAAVLRMISEDFPLRSNRYLGIYFLNERFFNNYGKPLRWSKFYLTRGYEEGDFASAYVLAYAVKNEIIMSELSYQSWIEKGESVDAEGVGYDRVISSLIQTGYLFDAVAVKDKWEADHIHGDQQ